MKRILLAATSAALCVVAVTAVGGLWRESISTAIVEPARAVNGGPVSTFIATPTSGPAPLVVEFSYNADMDLDYSIDFGDGQRSSISICAPPARSHISYCKLTAAHTYTSPGTYTAHLIGKVTTCAGDTDCKAPSEPETLGSAKIAAGNSAN